jgi:predicted phosphodiesterase
LKQIVVFGDIHANLPALEAVLEDMDNRGAANRYCLGDLVGYGTFPNEVIERIRTEKYPTLMGNYDLGVGISSDDCGCAYTSKEAEALGKRSIAWTNQNSSAENKAFLRGLMQHIPLKLGSVNVKLVHGSPRKINEYLYEDRPERSLERLMDLASADVLVCGHTHIPYHRLLPSGRHVVNAGSVGKPKDNDPRACYVIMEENAGDLRVDFIRVAYDIERAASAIESSEMPHEFAQMLREGKS